MTDNNPLEMPVAEWVAWQKTAYTSRRKFLRDVFYDQFLVRFFWDVTVEGLNYVPASGGAILMTSHSTLADTTLPLGVIKSRFIIPMTKEENFRTPGLNILAKSWGAFPVKRGAVDRRALQTTIELLQAGELVMMMPEGTRTPALQEAKDGLTYIALKADVPIIPAAIWGLEHFPQEMLQPWKRSDAHIRFGPPFRLNSGGRRHVPREEMSRMTGEMMYQLARLYPAHKRGYYADLTAMTTDYLVFE